MSDLFLETDRLILRQWRDADRPAFAALNADPEVMRHFPKALTQAECDALVDRFVAAINERGFGFWSVQVKDGADFIGFVGLSVPGFDAPFMPSVEVGWRLARNAWGFGYASEAARASLEFGFDTLGLKEIVSLTVPANQRSRAVMERLGMTRNPADDFDHPGIAADSPLHRHVLYRIGVEDYRSAVSA